MLAMGPARPARPALLSPFKLRTHDRRANGAPASSPRDVRHNNTPPSAAGGTSVRPARSLVPQPATHGRVLTRGPVSPRVRSEGEHARLRGDAVCLSPCREAERTGGGSRLGMGGGTAPPGFARPASRSHPASCHDARVPLERRGGGVWRGRRVLGLPAAGSL